MTTQDLTKAALPYVKRALRDSRPTIIEAIGKAAWLILWPAWLILTGPLLPILIRIGIELAIGLTSPRLLVFLELIARLIAGLPAGYVPEEDRRFLSELTGLLRMPRAAMLPSVQDALVWRDSGGGQSQAD